MFVRAPKKSDNTNYREILGAPKNGSQDDLEKAYRKAAIKNHPDKGGDPEKVKEHQFLLIVEKLLKEKKNLKIISDELGVTLPSVCKKLRDLIKLLASEVEQVQCVLIVKKFVREEKSLENISDELHITLPVVCKKLRNLMTSFDSAISESAISDPSHDQCEIVKQIQIERVIRDGISATVACTGVKKDLLMKQLEEYLKVAKGRYESLLILSKLKVDDVEEPEQKHVDEWFKGIKSQLSYYRLLKVIGILESWTTFKIHTRLDEAKIAIKEYKTLIRAIEYLILQEVVEIENSKEPPTLKEESKVATLKNQQFVTTRNSQSKVVTTEDQQLKIATGGGGKQERRALVFGTAFILM